MTNKRSILGYLSKWIFSLLWGVIRGINPKMAKTFLCWSLSDNAFVGDAYKDSILEVQAMGMSFANPVGLAAGFDRNVKYVDILLNSGFSFGELGTFTVQEDKSEEIASFQQEKQAITTSSTGYPNQGLQKLMPLLMARRHLPHIVGISITTPIHSDDTKKHDALSMDALEQDIIKAVQMVAPCSSYVVLNLSHPALPVSDLLTVPTTLEPLLKSAKAQIAKSALVSPPKLLVKVPCDLKLDAKGLTEAFVAAGVDGVIIAGAASSRLELARLHLPTESGLISGKPLAASAVELLKRFYLAANGRLTLISSGGVFTARDVLERLKAGASLVQIYSALLYEGPGIVNEINKDLAALMRKEGYQSVAQCIGVSVQPKL